MASNLVVLDYDVIIALGGGISPEGELPQIVKTRLDRLADHYSERPTKLIVTGRGKDRSYPVTEAEGGVKYLVEEKRIPAGDVYMENLSEDTWQNGFYTRTTHMDVLGMKNPLIVTSEFHMPRSGEDGVFGWVMHGDRYVPSYESVPNEGISPEDLETRLATEAKLIDFNERVVMPNIRKGNLRDLHAFIFDPTNPTGIEYREFLDTLNLQAGYGRK